MTMYEAPPDPGRRRKSKREGRAMSNAQVWYVLIAATVLIFLAILMMADAIKGYEPKSPPAKATSQSSPFDLFRERDV